MALLKRAMAARLSSASATRPWASSHTVDSGMSLRGMRAVGVIGLWIMGSNKKVNWVMGNAVKEGAMQGICGHGKEIK